MRFGIEPVRAASVVLADANGKPLAVGSTVRLQGAPAAAAAVVGYDGMVYLEGLGAHNVLEVDTPDGACRARFDYDGDGRRIPVIGPVACNGGAP